MRTNYYRYIVLTILGGWVWFLCTPAYAQEDVVLRVVSTESPPFFFSEETQHTGFLAELWEIVAEQMGVEYEVVLVDTFTDVLDAVQNGDADIAVLDISISAEREAQMDFSHPVLNDGYQIIVPTSQSEAPNILSILAGTSVFRLLGVVLLMLLVIAHLIWLIERHNNNEEFDTRYVQGVWDGFWWACVTMTGVGYGGQEPRRVFGRIIAIFWMFTGIIIVSLLAAEMTTALTVSQLNSGINSPDDLQGLRVATYTNSVYQPFVENMPVQVVLFEGNELFEYVAEGQVDAAIVSATQAAYYIATEGNGRVQLAGNSFFADTLAFALPNNSPHLENINTALLQVRESGQYGTLYDQWFGE